jgi:hypothetical protein
MAAIARLDPAVDWLLNAEEPVIRYRALVDLLDIPPDDARVTDLRRSIPGGPIVGTLLSGQLDDGGFGRDPYSKWTGGHWRLVSLMDLGTPADLTGAREAIEPVLRWLTGRAHRSNVPVIAGLARRCASQEGNALAVDVHFGLADDARSQLLAESLVGWQWPDGGWNCDRREAAHHSSFHESLPAFRGLAAYARATGDRAVADATERAAEFFLRHRVTYSERTGRPIGPEAARIHYPPYWRFDFLAGLRVLAESGHIGDPRTSDSLDLLEAKRGDDGRWAAEAVHFRPPGARSLPDAVDWGRRTPSEPVTLGAMLVLRAAGRARTGTDRGTIGVP